MRCGSPSEGGASPPSTSRPRLSVRLASAQPRPASRSTGWRPTSPRTSQSGRPSTSCSSRISTFPDGERAAIHAKAAAAVARGGTLLLVGHDVDNIGTGAPGPTNPSLLYTPADIVRELPDLEIERAEQVRRPTELEDGTPVEAVDALVLARRR